MDYDKFADFSPCDYAGPLKRESFMDCGIKELWQGIPRISGPAFTVEMVGGENLSLHRAIYEAPVGSIIVAQSNTMDYAVIGGNVSLIAKKRGIKGFVIDGLVRDIGEIRENQVAIFGRGVIPMPGGKKNAVPVNIPITAGGISVNPGDIIVADEEGVAVIPKEKAEDIYAQTKANVQKEKEMSFEQWAANHKDKIDSFYKI
ncbi:4-carboxy-4-hydroxy-2-oxoadipate aldolase [Malaciobacter pacificus]|uniref:Putative 4-hydroxy-4-methyl-2-oxoglutarate aldolase n=1 Tax=Malaciobacter pacificus TaxID=1080223 RepID=A0A5C2H4E1_9BACT|nr:RraA family protein [Malaciobacter pacificus]QEP33811.1 ribonuclease activity regulator, RraA family [Malaciobacter pacificus]GGD35406.1 4-carboxy-4-hydroxy-2-oxoadipate aldolase [Malaciobacter pacificus]